MNNNAMKKINSKLSNGDNSLVTLVGDSITWGCTHCAVEETFCAHLARLFAKKYPDVSVLRYDGIMTEGGKPLAWYDGPIFVSNGDQSTLTFVKSGVGGDTVKRALARSKDFIGEFITGELADVYLLMFGINDAINIPEKYVTPEGFYKNYKKLYDLIKENNPNADIVLLTPTYNDSGKSEISQLKPYSDMVKKLAKEENCQLIDTHEFWMKHLIVGTENYGQRDWLSGKEGDYCHFSPVGSLETAKFIFNELIK